MAANEFDRLVKLVGIYVVVGVGTLVTLAVLAALHSRQATPEAWGHAGIVGILALLLPVRLRAAGRGSSGAVTAIAVIAVVLVVVNVVEALIPGLFPVWMRVEMVVIAALMAAVALLTLRARH
jgi:hypothetical protein